MKWCMHKDKIVLNTSKNNLDISIKAYPMVITTVRDMKDRVQTFLKSIYCKSSMSDFHRLHNLKTLQSTDQADVNALKTDTGYNMTAGLAAGSPNYPPGDEEWTSIKKQISTLQDFWCQGITLGQTWASYLSCDTVASVLVGGMVTVQNGHFTMHTCNLGHYSMDFGNQ